MAIVCCLLIAAAEPARAALTSRAEYEVKAAFIYNFIKFVDWPPESFSGPNTAISVCVLGTDPFGSVLERTFSGRTIGGKELAIERLKAGEDATACHVLFISRSEEDNLDQILRGIQELSILTVGEMAGFASRGGVINFVKKEGRIRFEISMDAQRRGGLTISSKLLNLAILVGDRNPG